ncbi:Nephronectin [Acipenser ruthenus]|uniref:Nephronectin n=1 Tax=Acipenser ruthenus TaxID=7906 RepID=A0A444UHP3_ACIRT|nr:Nephronectin [Acipenser ruthenus]
MELLIKLVLVSTLYLGAAGDFDGRWPRRVSSSNGLCRYGARVDCCWGWTRRSWGQCQPLCQPECKHGECVGPNKCKCYLGYTGKTCNQDLNECGLKPRPCKHRCMNTYGSYKCYCLNGYMLMPDGTCGNALSCSMANCQYGCDVVKGETRCRCPLPGLQLGPDGRTCVDVDECATGRAVCPRFRKCINTFGSYICKCHEGFDLKYINGKYQCIDVNECLSSVHHCSSFAMCYNTPGSYKCKCKGGFKGTGFECKHVILHSCSFDHGLCGWLRDRESDLHWETTSDAAGGKYLTIPEVFGKRGGRAALLALPLGQSVDSGELCLSFRHKLSGQHSGSMQVYVKRNGAHGPAVWGRTGGHGWRHTQITLWGAGLQSTALFLLVLVTAPLASVVVMLSTPVEATLAAEMLTAVQATPAMASGNAGSGNAASSRRAAGRGSASSYNADSGTGHSSHGHGCCSVGHSGSGGAGSGSANLSAGYTSNGNTSPHIFLTFSVRMAYCCCTSPGILPLYLCPPPLFPGVHHRSQHTVIHFSLFFSF